MSSKQGSVLIKLMDEDFVDIGIERVDRLSRSINGTLYLTIKKTWLDKKSNPNIGEIFARKDARYRITVYKTATGCIFELDEFVR